MKHPGDPPVDPFQLGVQDARLSGWFNHDTRELAGGFVIGSHDIVVDVGCGDGGNAVFCAEQGAHVILADIHAESLKQAVARLRSSKARKVESYVTDANPLPLLDRSVTRVICTEVLEHVQDPSIVLRELARVGQVGALYLISAPDPVAERLQKALAPPAYFEEPNHIRIIDRYELDKLVEDAGLVIERRLSRGFFWAFWWLIFWQTGVPLSDPNHPALNAWARTWREVLQGKDGDKIRRELDNVMPKDQVVIARKPG